MHSKLLVVGLAALTLVPSRHPCCLALHLRASRSSAPLNPNDIKYGLYCARARVASVAQHAKLRTDAKDLPIYATKPDRLDSAEN
ncbi:hypothetical protein FB451DRAFT_368853 [Mycena latifolia]|nr:hypothetical protein FB451DRAFT_368853 [Mycena latifolia]